jgi:hypothetical protein
MKDFRKELNKLIQDFFGAEFNEGEEFGVTKYNNVEESPLSYDDVETFRCCVLSIFDEAMKANPVENRVSQPSELLPCPFCGSKGEIIKNGFPPRNRDRHPSCSNENCIAHVEEQDEQGGTNVDFYTDEEAKALWNKRAIQ